MPNEFKIKNGLLVDAGGAQVTGSLIAPNITGSLQGTASWAQNSVTASFVNPLTQTVVISGSLLTTGSNTFIGSQTVTGSLFTSGSNTLVGSTALTGALNITGSTTQVGNNTLLGNTTLSGSIIISGALGTNNPTVRIYGDTEHNGYIRFDPVSTNINTSVSASYIYVSGSTNDLYFTQNGAGYANTTRLRWLEGNLYTGLLNGGIISASLGTNTYTISSGSGIVVSLNASYNDNPYPTIQYVNWGNLVGTIDALSASYDQQFVSVLSNATIGSQGTPYEDGDYNTRIPIGIVIHQNRSTINAYQTFPGVAYGWKQRSFDFIRAFGPLKINGYTLAPSGSSTGSLVLSGGTAFVDGRNYIVDPNNPSYITEAVGISTSKIYRYRQSGSGWAYDTNAGAGYATIDPGNYSNGGVLTPVSSNNWTIQRVFYFPNSATKAFYIYYGNAQYANQTEALAAVGTETFSEAPNTAANAIYVGYMLLRSNANFTTAASYAIYQASLFRASGAGGGAGGGGGATTLASLTDVSITSPTDYEPFAYNSITAKWENRTTISASLVGNASTATTASYANTASYVLNAVSASFATNALTASYVTSTAVVGDFSRIATGSVTASVGVGASSFQIVSGASTYFFVSSSGNIGIGTTTPISKLNVNGATIITGAFTTTTDSNNVNLISPTGNTSLLRIADNATSATRKEFTIIHDYSNNKVDIQAVQQGIANRPITINAAGGNVGVLTASPSYSLDVGGSGRFTNGLQVTGSLNSPIITGSLFGTSSWAQNALTASYVLNAISASFASTASYVNPLVQTVQITGSLNITGSLSGSGDVLIKGSSNTSTTTALTVQNSDASSSFRVRNDGTILVGSSANAPQIYPGSSNGTLDVTGSNIVFRTSIISQSYGFGAFQFTGTGLAPTSGINTLVSLARSFSPVGGNADFYNWIIGGTINQTGGATGTTRGLFIAPTLTSAADWRSVEWTNNAATSPSQSWGLYGAGTAPNYLAGSLGIGTTSLTGYNLRIGKNITGGVNSKSILSAGQIQSDVTNTVTYFETAASKAAGFTLDQLFHYFASQATLSSTVNVQYGFYVASSLTGATNNYGYYGNIASGTGLWNLYMNGTAANYLNGNLLIGNTTDSGDKLQVTGAAKISGSMQVTGSLNAPIITGSLFGTASWANNSVTASYVLNSVSSSYAATASSADNFLVRQNITASNALFTGTITAQTLNVQYVTASTEFVTGSTKFGSQLTDTHQFTGSVSMTGSLAVTGDTTIKGSGNTSGTTALTVQNSDGTNIFRVLNDGQILPLNNGSLGTTSNRLSAIYISNGCIFNSAGVATFSLGQSTAGAARFSVVNNSVSSATSGEQIWSQIENLFAPTSGNAVYNHLKLNITINQTGGANGITRGLYVNPTLTAAADWRSIEWSNNTGWGLYGAGGASNYLSGSLSIGTTSTGSATLNISGSGRFTNGIQVTGSLDAPNITGSLFGTSSWAQNAVTASFVTTAQTASYVLNAVSSSFASNAATASFVTTAQTASFVATASWAINAITASYILNAVSASFVSTASYVLQAVSASFATNAATASYLNPLNQGNVIITGSLYISGSNSSLILGGNATASTEASLVIGIPPAAGSGEGGQIILQAPNASGYTSASMFDNYQNKLRILRGNNTTSDAAHLNLDMHTGQFTFNQYLNASSFPGTATANLAVDSSGNIITVSTSGGTVFPYTGNAQINGGLGVTGSISSTGPIYSQTNGAMYFRGGDDAEFWDINVANTVGIYGQQDQGIGAIKLGSGGGTLTGRSGSIGIGTTTPDPSTKLDVAGNTNISGSLQVTGSASFTGSVSATQGGFTGSLLGTASWAQNSVTASFVTTAQTASYVLQAVSASFATNSATASYVTLAQTASFVTTAQTASYVLQSVSASFATNASTASFVATASWAQNAVTASYVTGSIFTPTNPALSASYALTASYALSGGTGGSGLKTKAGSVANSSFAGNPRKATVTFGTAFPDTNYAVTVTGEDSRTWTIESKVAGSFVINANSNVGLAGTTYWIATAYGETA